MSKFQDNKYKGQLYGWVNEIRGYSFYRSIEDPIVEIMVSNDTKEVTEDVKIRELIYKWAMEDRQEHQQLIDYVNFTINAVTKADAQNPKSSFEFLIYDSFVKSEVIAMTIAGIISYLEDTTLTNKQIRKDFTEYDELCNFQRLRNVAVHDFNKAKSELFDRGKLIKPMQELSGFSDHLESISSSYYKVEDNGRVKFETEAAARCLEITLNYIDWIKRGGK